MKNKMLWAYLVSFTIIFGVLITLFTFLIMKFRETSYNYKLTLGTLIFIVAFLMNLSFILSYVYVKKKREEIKGAFDYYIENQISNAGLGVIIFNKNEEIIWVSSFIEAQFGACTIGKKLSSISRNFGASLQSRAKPFWFKHEGFVLEVIICVPQRLIIVKNVTSEEKILKQYIVEKLVMGELEIDNFPWLQVTLSEEEIFSVHNAVIKVLNQLASKWNFIYHQYINGKFFFLTNKELLDQLIASKFNFVEEIRKKKVANECLSVSIGIGYDPVNQKLLQELAHEGLKYSHAWGGDQTTLMEFNKNPIYYGSQYELQQSMSRVKISKVAKLFEDKLQSLQIKNVIIYGHKLADLDALGAALGIKSICEAYHKKTFIGNVNFDTTSDKILKSTYPAQHLANVFIKPFHAARITSEATLVVIVDTMQTSHLENPEALVGVAQENIFILDHHRTQGQAQNIVPQNVYIDPNASSTAEIVVEMISFITHRIKLDHQGAQMLPNGIFLDTSMFTKSVSTRTYMVASFLERQGPNSAVASNIMKTSEEAAVYIKQMLANLQEIKPGYFLAFYQGIIPDDYIAMAADEILRTQECKGSFGIAHSPQHKNLFKMSARGVDTNVQKIAEQVGGGGHFSSAAAMSRETQVVFIDNLRQAIIPERGE